MKSRTKTVTATTTSLEVELKSTDDSHQMTTAEQKSLPTLLALYLTAISADGKWAGQVKGNLSAVKKRFDKCTVMVSKRIDALRMSVWCCTADGDIREVILIGNLKADEIIMRTQALPGGFFSESKQLAATSDEGEKKGGLPPQEEPTFGNEEVILFLSLIHEAGGTVLTGDLKKSAHGIGGEKLIEHCLAAGLLLKDGTSAFTLTPSGQEFVTIDAPQVETPPEEIPPALDIDSLLAQAQAASAVLEEKKDAAKRLGRLKKTRDDQVQQLAAIKAEIETLTSVHEAKRLQILDQERQIRQGEEDQNDERFAAAEKTLEGLRKLKALLG